MRLKTWHYPDQPYKAITVGKLFEMLRTIPPDHLVGVNRADNLILLNPSDETPTHYIDLFTEELQRFGKK